MSDELQTAATIASLRAEVERLKAELHRRVCELGVTGNALDERRAYAERLLAENVRLSNEAATARERAGVLEAEVLAFRLRYITPCSFDAGSVAHTIWYTKLAKLLETAMTETDRTHALDAAKFGGVQ